jgi:putative peptidoglycan lipid II flippase
MSDTAGRRDGEITLRKSTKKTTTVMVSTFVSRLLGFIRIAVIGAVFGTTGEADVINAVFTIPNNLRKLLAEGALSSAFIPVLSKALVREKTREGPRRIVGNILAFQLMILIPLCALSIIFAKPLISKILVDFQDAYRTALAVELFRYFINYLLLISISAVLIAVLNSHDNFFIPAVTPILFSISVITSILLLHRTMGVFSMAVGVLAGGILQILFQTPSFYKLNYNFKLDFNFNNEYFKTIMKQWLPVMATASIFTINQQVAIRFATGLEIGSSSALSYALVFFQLPFGIFSASVTTVLFPRMSRQASGNDRDGLRESVQYGIRFLLTLLVPSTIVLALLSKEIISVAMYRGEFTREATLLTSQILIGYVIGLFSTGCFTFLQRFFYAIGNYRVPFRLSVIICAVDIGLSLWLKETYLRVIGLAVANTAAFTVGLVLIIILTRKSLTFLGLKNILKTVGKIAVSMVPVVLVLEVYLFFTGSWWAEPSSLMNLVLLLGAAVLSIGITFIMYYVLRVEMLVNLIKKKRLV